LLITCRLLGVLEAKESLVFMQIWNRSLRRCCLRPCVPRASKRSC